MTAIEPICEELARKYGALGEQAAERLRRWLSGALPFAFPEILARQLDVRHAALLFDAFYQVLPFGTGGRRGRVGYGSNRFNPTTLAMTVQGHCNYLRATFGDRPALAVVVANDVRVFKDIGGTYGFLGNEHPLLGVSSRSLGRLACEIYAANGISVYFNEPTSASAVLSTPELSYLIGRSDEIVGGVNLSASHNPPDDNGVKVYDEHGSQPIAPHDQRLVEAMDLATDVRSLPFEEALARGLVKPLPEGAHEDYLRGYEEMFGRRSVSRKHVVTYTPLCGCGLETAGALLERVGFNVVTPPDEAPSGEFGPIPFRAPNPEVPQATAPARAFADAHHSGLVLSSDPDADRIGVEVKLADGSWYHFDGNQIAATLGYYLMLDPEGPKRRGLVMETLVTTKILGRIAQEASESFIIDDLLVGFKYVADVLKRLGRGESYRGVRCAPEALVLAAEESHGVIVKSSILDKDAAPACMYLADLHVRLAERGQNLLDYYIHILERLGGYDNVNRSIMMSGADGMARKDRIMQALRDNPPREFCGYRVTKRADYWDEATFGPFLSETDKSPRNVLQFFTDAVVVTIRPSGTEAKLKLYCQLLPITGQTPLRGQELLSSVRALADKVALQVYGVLLERIDITLSEIGLMLPDVVDLDFKVHFDRTTVPEFKEQLKTGQLSALEAALAWLTRAAQAMTPGTSPLPALKLPLAGLLRAWAHEPWTKEPAIQPLLSELEAWSKQ